MQRTILSVGYPLTEVGADAVGGSEQILTMLDRTLTEAGHRSLVIAAAGSQVSGTLIESPAAPRKLDHSAHEWGRLVHRQLIRETLAKHRVDLIHMHSLDFHCYMPLADIPILATLHLPQDWFPRSIFNTRRRNFRMNCVSWSQHCSCPKAAHMVEPISNGIDVERLSGCVQRKGSFALALGRVCPEKAFHRALDAARLADMPLLLAGQVFPYSTHLQYFSTQLAPRLDRQRRFIGPVRFARKRQLLSSAKCLVISSTVAETSSLVAMEALACGTPVVAFRSGALPEIVDHGITGFIVDTVDEMAEALRAVEALDPEKCRQIARRKYSAQVMGKMYLNLYEQMITQSTPEYVTPIGSSGRQWAIAH